MHSVKHLIRDERTGKKKLIRNITDCSVLLPQVGAQFIIIIIINQSRFYSCSASEGDLISRSGFNDSQDPQFTLRGKITNPALSFEEANTRLIFHLLMTIKSNNNRVLVVCKDIYVLLLLLYFLGRNEVETWMVSVSARQRKCCPVSQDAQILPADVRKYMLSVHALTYWSSTFSFKGFRKGKTYNLYHDDPHLLEGIRRAANCDAVVTFLCYMYGTKAAMSVNEVRLSFSGKTK